MRTLTDLIDLAAESGVTVEYASLGPLGRNGDYNHHTRTIRLNMGMMPRLERHVLAHELGHAVRGDEPTMHAHFNARMERLADEHAAHLLIDPDEYRHAEERHNGHISMIAQELYVIDRTVEAYRRTLVRLGDTIYQHSRMGVGQFARKLAA